LEHLLPGEAPWIGMQGWSTHWLEFFFFFLPSEDPGFKLEILCLLARWFYVICLTSFGCSICKMGTIKPTHRVTVRIRWGGNCIKNDMALYYITVLLYYCTSLWLVPLFSVLFPCHQN
jgi:hypothetical protein